MISYKIKDDGIGIDFNKSTNNLQETKGFGLELVKSLVASELDGSFDISNDNGTSIKILF